MKSWQRHIQYSVMCGAHQILGKEEKTKGMHVKKKCSCCVKILDIFIESGRRFFRSSLGHKHAQRGRNRKKRDLPTSFTGKTSQDVKKN